MFFYFILVSSYVGRGVARGNRRIECYAPPFPPLDYYNHHSPIPSHPSFSTINTQGNDNTASGIGSTVSGGILNLAYVFVVAAVV